MPQKKVLIIGYSWLYKDPRILVQFHTLAKEFNIETLGLAPIHADVPHYKMAVQSESVFFKILKYLLLATRLFSLVEWLNVRNTRLAEVQMQEYDLIVCNDLSSMPYATKIANKNIPIWLDMHEYSPREFEQDKKWEVFFQPYMYWFTKKYIHQAAVRTTVCEGLAQEYTKEFNVNMEAIIYNAPAYRDLQPSAIDKDQIRLVHHGGAQPERELETMIDMLAELGDGYSLDFYLMKNSPAMEGYETKLKALATSKNLKVHFNDAVPTEQIPTVINQYDIGVFILRPVNFNYLYALPNKLFEYVQGRLALAVSPNPEMKRMVETNNLGIVADGYSAADMAKKIRAITTEQLEMFKKNAQDNAKQLSAIDSKQKILRIVQKLVSE